jgi:hypothetical protein
MLKDLADELVPRVLPLAPISQQVLPESQTVKVVGVRDADLWSVIIERA